MKRFLAALLLLALPTFAEAQSYNTAPPQSGDYLQLNSHRFTYDTFATIGTIFAAQVPINVINFGAVADCPALGGSPCTDNTAAFQNAANAAKTQGKTLRIPGGANGYYLSGGFALDYSAVTDATSPRSSVECDRGSTRLIFANGNFNGLSITGGTISGVSINARIAGCRFEKADVQGTGLLITRIADLDVEANSFAGWNFGIVGIDNLSSDYSKNMFSFNNFGMDFQRGNFSYPNAIASRSNKIGGNNILGIQLANPSVFLSDHDDIEGNGSQSITTYRGGILVNGGPIEGGQSITVRNAYFEANGGRADIDIIGTGAVGAGGYSASIEDSTFNRTSNALTSGQPTGYVTNNILLEGTEALHLRVSANAFKALGTYTPNPANQYINDATGGSAIIEWSPTNAIDSAIEFAFVPRQFLSVVTVGSLPACNSGSKGTMVAVSDAATSPAYNATVAAGGSVSIPVYCNGTNWTNH